MTHRPQLDLNADVVTLTRNLCDIPSVSGAETELADAVETALCKIPWLQVDRDGDAVVARTHLGRSERVILAGHLDTVPLSIPPNLPTRIDGDYLIGRGTTDMKGGVAVALRMAATLPDPTRDVTYVFYDCEEVAEERNGLGRLVSRHPDWLAGDFAVLLEPSNEAVEGGCNGFVTVAVHTRGVASHSARPWRGHNAIHDVTVVIDAITTAAASLPTVDVDGLPYRQSLNAVGISGGIADNVIPDHASVLVNLRFAPRWSTTRAVQFLTEEVFAGMEVEVVDVAEGARPGLDVPAAADFVESVGLPVQPKLGWTDVARFSALGIPAVNFGPGESIYAHAEDERCAIAQLHDAERLLSTWLVSPSENRTDRTESAAPGGSVRK